MKRLVTLISILLMVGVLLCSCGGGESGYTKIVVTKSLDGKPVLVGNQSVDFPLVSSPTTLSIMCSSQGQEAEDQESIYVWRKYEEMTGVNIKWTSLAKKKRAEAVETALINNQKVDLILRCKISTARLSNYAAGGYILDLAKDDLLKNNAPNCWAFLQKHPETLASITNPDGSIYSLPQVNSGAELRVSRKIFVNKKWLERVDMELPETTEELYDLLKAFKLQDANGNGIADDEIPFCPIDWLSVQDTLYGAFGLGNRGVHNLTIDAGGGNRARLIAGSDGYKKLIAYLNRLYSEGLIDQNMFAMPDGKWDYNVANDLIGVFAATNLAGVPADKQNDWLAIEDALEGPDGYKLWAAVRANFNTEGSAVIPATCSNPALVLRWLDYFWTDEGTLFYHMGIEGETFVEKEDGTYDYTQSIYDEISNGNETFDAVVSRYSPYPGGGNPTVEIAPYFMGGEMADVPAAAARSLFEYATDTFWPVFTFTAEDNAAMNAIRSDIDKYVTESRIAFVTGTKPLDEWNAYLLMLTERGAATLLVNYQNAIQRYNAFLDSRTEQ